MMRKANQNAGLWWVSIISLTIGISVYIMLEPVEYDLDVQKYRSMALIASIMITGLCVIIGTRRHWFGKGL